MIVIPAIDILDGRVVRLEQGRPERELRVGSSPHEVAVMWERAGAELLHIVDIGAALGRTHFNMSHVRLIRDLSVRVQMAGGIRQPEIASQLLDMGVYRVVLSTLAVSQPQAIVRIVDKYGPDRVAVSLDYDGQGVCTHGWTQTTSRTINECIRTLHDAVGLRVFILTDVKRDGMLCGLDITTLEAMRANSSDRFIAAGGVCSLRDIEHVRALGLEGVIIGRALYEGRFSFADACRVARGET